MSKFTFKSLALLAILGVSISSYGQSEAQIANFTKAAKFDDISEVKALIAAGVSPNAVDSKGDPMLVIAIRDKSAKVIDFLLKDKKTDVDLSNSFGETPLMLASIEGDLPVVKTLVLQNKAKIDHIGWTPLHYACAKGQLNVAQFLIANGAMIDSRAPNGTTPLMMATQAGNEELIKLLLDKGADLRMRNLNGFSAIDIAEIYQKPWIADGLKSRWQRLYKESYPGPAKVRSAAS
ncbi:ankyrin repeat domain-containing protein [Polynucleobacter sp. JS-JIR-5-A7]|uniref:ankyrin repeat domain-containing protein n=1 Tax=Polynucleobacter sp. JS-JIR-5-A7 TaxID=1758395 RepID=UPI001BFD4445|nr:ankyrin repeat domain-containing protein [Polynucleobacter sp. JS-JIR-5-A7]QWE07603.1 ankyrin repeat domain-containing protein [Polynucleobacter sp. JS-JIR-5-A7]